MLQAIPQILQTKYIILIDKKKEYKKQIITKLIIEVMYLRTQPNSNKKKT